MDDLESRVRTAQEALFEIAKKCLDEHGGVPMVYAFLHADGRLETEVLPDAEESTKVIAAKAVKNYVIRLAFRGRSPLATFLSSDTWYARVAGSKEEALSVPASQRLNRQEAIVVSCFTPQSAWLVGRTYRREGKRIVWQEDIPAAAPIRVESRFDPWLAKREAS